MEIAGYTIELTMVFVWIALLVIFIAVEALTMGLTSIWFAIGAAAAVVTAIAGGGTVVQIIVFLVVSIASLAATRPWAKKKLNRELKSTNIDAIIGRRGTALTTIDKNTGGRVKADGKDWAAATETGSIEKDAVVVVKDVRGVTLIVAKEEE